MLKACANCGSTYATEYMINNGRYWFCNKDCQQKFYDKNGTGSSGGDSSGTTGAELEVQTIVDGLPGVVAAAPVGNDGPVEAPLPFQYTVQQALIVADVLTFVQII